MRKFQTDIEEIIALANCIDGDEYNESYEKCLGLFTEYVDEPYLIARAKAIKEVVRENVELQKAFKKMATVITDPVSDDFIVRKYCNSYIRRARERADKKELQMIDLFCGAGGLSLGFTQEGFVTALANDIEECCINTYAHNHPETPRSHIVQGDICEVVDQLDELIGEKNIDIVIGGPPCQGYSMANRQRLIDDPRNQLYKKYVEVVNMVRPCFFVMENVRGMLSIASQVKEDFDRIGYSVEYHVLNAKDYGVPQNRERLIFIGNRKGIDNEKIFSEIIKLAGFIPDYVLGDAIAGLRPLVASHVKHATCEGTKQSGYIIEKNRYTESNDYIDYINQGRTMPMVFNHKARYNNDRDVEIFGRMYQGDRADDPKIADIMPYARRNGIFKDKYFKLEEQIVCKTITAHMKYDCNMYIHPTQARGLTPREAARVQSYPDDYFFRGAYTKTYMQIGNSVPPLLGRAIAKVIKPYIEREKNTQEN